MNLQARLDDPEDLIEDSSYDSQAGTRDDAQGNTIDDSLVDLFSIESINSSEANGLVAEVRENKGHDSESKDVEVESSNSIEPSIVVISQKTPATSKPSADLQVATVGTNGKSGAKGNREKAA